MYMYEPINSARAQSADENTNPPVQTENGSNQLGIVFRISIPAGAEINLMGLIEMTSPGGISLIIRTPIPGTNPSNLSALIQSIKQAGGTIEVVK